MDIRLALMCGTDIPIIELQTVIHQPTIKEIAYVGEQEFFIGVQTITINKNIISLEDKTVLENTSNFQIFMTIIQEQEMRDKKNAVVQLFSLIFPGYQVVFMPRTILLTKKEQQIMIDENNFEILQEILKKIFCMTSNLMGQGNFNPGNKQAKEIAEKLMRGRERVSEQKGEKHSSAFVKYLSILAIGTNTMSLSKLVNLTMYQLYDLVERYTLYLNWDLDIRTRLAGGKPDNPPDDWMKDIH